MVIRVIGRSLQVLNKQGRHLTSPALFSQTSSTFLTFTVCSCFTKAKMATSADLARVKAKAEQTEKILTELQHQIEAIKKAAVKQAGLSEEETLTKENGELKKEIEAIRRELILAEIGNGVRQVYLPTKGALSAILAPASAASASTPLVNGVGPESSKEQEAKAKKKEEATGKKKQPIEQPEVGGKKAKTEKKGKEPKAEGEGDAKSKNAKVSTTGGDAGDGPMDVSRLDLRVGKIVSVEKHPDADSLYVEKVDLGEGKTRTVVSGLVKHYPLNAMKDRVAVFMCNLKPAKMRGVLSEGMIMCAVGPEKTEILVPPTESVIGDKVTALEYPGAPDAQLNPKKKIWETLKPDVKTNDERIATFKGAHLQIIGKGSVVAPTLANTQIS